MQVETNYIRSLLPKHYTCKPRTNGVHCYSDIGIDENDEHFDFFIKALQQKYGARFLECFHQTSSKHKKFTVYIEPEN